MDPLGVNRAAFSSFLNPDRGFLSVTSPYQIQFCPGEPPAFCFILLFFNCWEVE